MRPNTTLLSNLYIYGYTIFISKNILKVCIDVNLQSRSLNYTRNIYLWTVHVFYFCKKTLLVSFNLNTARFPLFSNFHSSRFLLPLSGVRAAVYEKILLSSVGCLPLLLLLICVHPFVFLQKSCVHNPFESLLCLSFLFFILLRYARARQWRQKIYIFALPGKLSLCAQTKNPAATAALSVTRFLFWETHSEYFRQTNKHCFCFSLSIFTLLKFYFSSVRLSEAPCLCRFK